METGGVTQPDASLRFEQEKIDRSSSRPSQKKRSSRDNQIALFSKFKQSCDALR